MYLIKLMRMCSLSLPLPHDVHLERKAGWCLGPVTLPASGFGPPHVCNEHSQLLCGSPNSSIIALMMGEGITAQ